MTQLSTGGDSCIFLTATGINPEDINIDGDGFVIDNFKGPEELVTDKF